MKTMRGEVIALTIAALSVGAIAFADETGDDDKVLRAGMIGLDTSHVIAFTKVFNDPKATGDVAKVRVVAGYPGGSDISSSRDRVAGYTQQLREMGLEIVPSIAELLKKVDVVLLESVDGNPHLAQARPVIEAGKPLFIDKPVAGSLADAIAIYTLAIERGVPCFSSSSLRYYPGFRKLAEDGRLGKIAGCATWGPCSIQPNHPDLFWYGVHGVETLYTIMGTGCTVVTRAHTPDTDLVTGVWADGRIGTYRGIRRNKAEFGAIAFGEKAIVVADRAGGYAPLVDQIATFFLTGKPPVSAEETIEIFAFMEAADESKRRGGAPVVIAEVISAARATLKK